MLKRKKKRKWLLRRALHLPRPPKHLIKTLPSGLISLLLQIPHMENWCLASGERLCVTKLLAQSRPGQGTGQAREDGLLLSLTSCPPGRAVLAADFTEEPSDQQQIARFTNKNSDSRRACVSCYKLLSGRGGELAVSGGALGSLLLEGREVTCYSGWKDSGGIPGMRIVRLSLHLQTPCGWPLGGLGDYVKD